MKAFGVLLASSIVFDEHDKVFIVNDKYSQEVNTFSSEKPLDFDFVLRRGTFFDVSYYSGLFSFYLMGKRMFNTRRERLKKYGLCTRHIPVRDRWSLIFTPRICFCIARVQCYVEASTTFHSKLTRPQNVAS